MSFGHAAYLGIGGYAVGMQAQEGILSSIQWPVALAASALFPPLVIGALSLRTRGVYFIMITLALTQMAYYVCAGRALQRRRRPDHLQAQRIRGTDQFVEQGAVLLRLPGVAVGRDLSGLAHRQFALRAGDPGRTSRTTPACARSGFDLCVTNWFVRHCRHAVRSSPGTLLANHTDFVSQRQCDGALGRSHHHGGARRHGVAVRPADWRSGYCCWRKLLSASPVLANHPGPLLLLVVLFARVASTACSSNAGCKGALAEQAYCRSAISPSVSAALSPATICRSPS